MSTRGRLQSSVLATVDIADQPECPFVFIIENALGNRQAFSVDTVAICDNVVYARRGGQDIVILSQGSAWGVIARSEVVFRTMEESYRKREADNKAENQLVKELFPENGGHNITAMVEPARPGFYA